MMLGRSCAACAARLLEGICGKYVPRKRSGEASYSAIAGVELEASRYDEYTCRRHFRSPGRADAADRADRAETSREDSPGAATHTLGAYSVRWTTLASASGNRSATDPPPVV